MSKRIENYDRNKCPFCGIDCPSCTGEIDWTDGTHLNVGTYCPKCGKHWTEIYELQGAEIKIVAKSLQPQSKIVTGKFPHRQESPPKKDCPVCDDCEPKTIALENTTHQPMMRFGIHDPPITTDNPKCQGEEDE